MSVLINQGFPGPGWVPLDPSCGIPVALFLLLSAFSPPLCSVPFPPQQGHVVFIHWIPGPSCWIPVALFLFLSLIVHIFKRSGVVCVNQSIVPDLSRLLFGFFALHCSYSSRPSLLPSTPYLSRLSKDMLFLYIGFPARPVGFLLHCSYSSL